MGMLRIQSVEGDTTLLWDPKNKTETAQAEATFKERRLQGFMAYRTVAVNSSAAVRERPQVKGETITTFDPKADEIVMTVPLQGG